MQSSLDIADRMLLLFGGLRSTRYRPAMSEPDTNGKVRPAKIDKWCGPPNVALWEKHLRGECGIGILPPGADGRVLFGAIDVDLYDDAIIDRSSIVERVYAEALPLVPVRTKSGGLHLLLFAAQPVDAGMMAKALRNQALNLGLPLKQAGGSTEIIFQTNIWMPYSNGDNTKRYGIKKHGLQMTTGEFLVAADKAKLDSEAFAVLAQPVVKGNKVTPDPVDGVGYAAQRLAFYSSELAAMADGEGRNSYLNAALHQMGRLIGAGWIARSKVERELRQVADFIGMDQAKTDEMLRRRNGPIDKGMKEPCPDIAVPQFVDRITKIISDPPLYLLHVGDRAIELTVETITNFRLFKAIYFQNFDRMPPVKASEWDATLTKLMKSVKYEKAPEGANLADRFLLLLNEYLTDRAQGERREDLSRGVPWHDEDSGRRYFTLQGFYRFLVQEKANPFQSESPTQLGRRIRKLGGNDARPGVGKGRSIAAWWVPSDAIEAPLVNDAGPLSEQEI